MRVSLGQILVLFFIFFLVFGDFQNLKKRVKHVVGEMQKFLKNKKKRT